MTPEAQRIAIAEVCWWTLCRADNKTWRTPEQKRKNLELLGHENGPWSFESSGPPDYLNDLNAAREAVLSLPKDKRNRYVNELQDIIQRDNEDALVQPDLDFYWCNASAKQMSEAFLRTLELWTDQ